MERAAHGQDKDTQWSLRMAITAFLCWQQRGGAAHGQDKETQWSMRVSAAMHEETAMHVGAAMHVFGRGHAHERCHACGRGNACGQGHAEKGPAKLHTCISEIVVESSTENPGLLFPTRVRF
eukprot:360786-Chlamydomonas_euryale.AAC.6